MTTINNCSVSTKTPSAIVGRSIRVVVFGGGPILDRGVKEFICRLEQHNDIDLLGAVCQPGEQHFPAIAGDLLKRRGILGLPLLVVQALQKITLFFSWQREATLNRQIRRLSKRIHFVSDIHAPDVLDRVRSLAPDLGLVYGSPVLKPELFQIPTLGTLGIHHGKAPEYRGKKTTFWAMYNGEPTAAVTIQKINAGLDTGEIVKQGSVAVEGRSYRTVCTDLERLGIDLYLQTIMEVKQGIATYSPQLGQKRKLCRDPKLSDLLKFTWRQFTKRFA